MQPFPIEKLPHWLRQNPRILLHTFLLIPPGSNRISLAVIRRNLRRLAGKRDAAFGCGKDAKQLRFFREFTELPGLYFSWNIPIKIVHRYSMHRLLFSLISEKIVLKGS